MSAIPRNRGERVATGKRFEFRAGASLKFWEITQHDRRVIVRFGRIGSQGQEQQSLYDSDESAKRAAEKLTRSKLAKGYRPAGQKGTATEPATPHRSRADRSRPDGVVAQLVQQVIEVRRQLDADVQLGAPTPPELIDKEERRQGFKFPASYRQFLELHNGALHFWPDWSLVGVSGALTNEVRKDIRHSLIVAKNAVAHDAELEGLTVAKALAKLEKREQRSRAVIHPLRHPVFGADFNGGILVFDQAHKAAEPEVASIRNGELENRWKSFTHWLQTARKDLMKQVKEARTEKPQRAKPQRAATAAASNTSIDSAALASLFREKQRSQTGRLISASADNTLLIWDVEARRRVAALTDHARSRGGVFGVRVAPTANVAASWADDRTIRLWNTSDGKALGVLVVAKETVSAVAFHPRDALFGAVVDGAIRIWNLSDGTEPLTIPERRSGGGTVVRSAVGFDPEGRHVVAATGDGEVEVFDLGKGTRVDSWRAVPESADAFDVGRLKWSPNGESVSLSSEDSIWLKSSRKGGRSRKITFDKAVMDYAWSTDSTRLIVAVGDGVGQQTVDGPRGWWITLKRADGNPTSLAYRSDKHSIAEGTSKGAIRLRAPENGEVVATLQGHTKEVSGLAFL